MSADSPRHVRSGGPLTVPSQPPSDRSIIDAVSGFINDVTLSSNSSQDPKDVIQWARFETADINEPTPEGDSDNDVSPLLLILGYGSGVQVWLIPPAGEAQEVLSWRQGTVRVLRILPTPQHGDCFASKRPLIALCDSASPGPSFCSLSFISIRGGEQVKSIKFKNPILDVLANKRSVVVSFSERFAVFDASTLEDRMAVTTCYPCPCPLGGSLPINPLALGDRWLAYADKKLNPSKRSSGGCEAEGVTSYTATVLHAAKSLSKGLRGLGESVAHSLAGRSASQSPSPPNTDLQQPGVVTVLDIEGTDEEDGQDSSEACDPIIAHFIAHSEAIIALKFDASGLLLITADRRGHDFHVFRLHPHPCGPALASVHHLYILHRGDTTAKVQDIAISCDARWAAVSTLRGTTHVFALSPYGGACGVRTHTQARVVNRLSRFHRSAGLPIHAQAHKRAANICESLPQGSWYPNPRLPPFPLPVTTSPLAQLRPSAHLPTTLTRTSSGRQRLSSLSEDSSVPLLARARFGPALSARAPAPVAALYLMAPDGALLHLLLHPKPLSSIPKEKVSDESAIELEVEAVAQWPLARGAAPDVLAPLPPASPLLQPAACRRCADMCMSEEERWLSQVEIVTHAGPHRRLWMGPQFVFKTYNCTGSVSSLSEAEAVEVDPGAAPGPARSNPVNMPGARPIVPVLIDSGSASSLEQSPVDSFRRKSLLSDSGRASVTDVQLREDLAEAMKEDSGSARGSSSERGAERAPGGVARAVDPLGTVVQPGPCASPGPEPEPAAVDNADEASFRGVRLAPAAPPHAPTARSLPGGTTIPACARACAPDTPPGAPAAVPLPTAVLIPAALEPIAPPYRAPEDALVCARVREPPPRDNREVRKSPDDREREEPKVEKMNEPEPVQETKPVVETDESKNVDVKLSPKAEFGDRKSYAIDKETDGKKDSFAKIENIGKMQSSAKVEKVRKVEPVKAEKVSKSEFASRQSVPKEKASVAPQVEAPSVTSVSVNTASKKKASEPKPIMAVDNSIKTEEQAWDMLLNEPDKPVLSRSAIAMDDKIEESKPKSKKNRKLKKAQEESQPKNEEDTFVEIHAIEEQKQQCSGELVSISTPFEDIEPISYLAKAKKSRSSKSVTPERREYESCDVWAMNEVDFIATPVIHRNEDVKDTAVVTEVNVQIKSDIDQIKTNTLSVNEPAENMCTKESPRTKKSKSLSPYTDRKSVEKRYESEVKDVYVIDSMKEEFPVIQITKGKSSKKSPQPDKKLETKSQEVEIVEKPIKSWSSIAAAKNAKIEEKYNVKGDVEQKIEKENILVVSDKEKPGSSTVYLQEKLFELCKRTDIMVAECDAPKELNFVDEHHSVLDLPPLEPLDFGLDDFKLEVMRDSLLDINDPKITSPLCNINIDSILSTIKETTNKAIECSAFNLIDLEKVPVKREKGFSVVENDKITSQEVKVDDDKDIEVMEKSSDDDNTSPVVSTDSDKDDRKPTGASSVALPSTKQSNKNKKSRKKKK